MKQQFKSLNQLNQALFCHNDFFYYKQTWNKLIIINRNYLSEKLLELTENPDDFMQSDILKADTSHTTTVSKIKLDNKTLVIKRYNIKNFLHSFKRAITPSRAARCWRYAHAFLWHGINTPQPIAIIENRFGPLRRQAYFIYEFVPGPQGFEVFRDNPADFATTRLRAEKTIAMLKNLFQHQFSHGDMKASNFIYHDNEPYFIDLDKTTRHRWKFIAKREKKKELQRFMENWEDEITKKLFAD